MELSMTDRRTFLKTLGLTAGTAAVGGVGLSAANDGSDSVVDPLTDWPRVQLDAANTGYASGTPGRERDPVPRWSLDLGYDGLGSGLVYSGDLAYVTTNYGLVAVDLAEREEAWRFEIANATPSPTLLDGTVYVSGRENDTFGDGAVFAVDAADGTEEWRFTFDDHMDSQVTVADGTVYIKERKQGDVNQPTITVYAVDAATGSELWRYSDDRSYPWQNERPASAVADGTLYVTNNGYLYALDAETGTEQWVADVAQYSEYDSSSDRRQSLFTPTVSDGRVYVTLTQYLGYVLFAFDTDDGSLDWQTERFEYEDEERTDFVFENGGSPAVANGVVYLGGESASGTTLAFDAEDGTNLWGSDGLGSAALSPVVTDERVYVGIDAGCNPYSHGIGAFGTADGTYDWFVPTRSGIETTALDDGRIYTLDQEGYFYAFGDAPDELDWRTETGSEVRSSLAVADGRVYAGNDDGNFYAMDAASGDVLWEYDADTAVQDSVVLADGMVYATSETAVFALDEADGTERWRASVDDWISTDIAVGGDRVYVGAHDGPDNRGTLYALDAQSGAVTWRFSGTGCPETQEITATPALGDGTVYVGTGTDRTLWALDAKSGQVEWSKDERVESLAVADDTLYVGREHQVDDPGWRAVVALRADDGTEKWVNENTYPGDGLTWTEDLRAADGTVYAKINYDRGGTNLSKLHALRADDGTEKWQFRAAQMPGDELLSDPTVSGDSVFVGGNDWRAYDLDADDGTVRRRYETSGRIRGAPAVGDDELYVGSEDGHVYAFDREE